MGKYVKALLLSGFLSSPHLLGNDGGSNLEKVVAIQNSEISSMQSRIGWKLMYENDEQGRVVNGSKEKLIKALKNGADVKVIWNAGVISHHANTTNAVWIVEDEVYLQAINEKSIKIKNNRVVFQDKTYLWDTIFSTDGTLEMKRHYVEGGKPLSHDSKKVGIKWFARF